MAANSSILTLNASQLKPEQVRINPSKINV
jgi:hypothetical protein